jgi:hypothetical protein
MHPRTSALAKESLINADGIIEESLQAHTVRKDDGVIELELITIKDYHYATDGLQVWDSIRQWVADYIKVYYFPNATAPPPSQLLQEETGFSCVGFLCNGMCSM